MTDPPDSPGVVVGPTAPHCGGPAPGSGDCDPDDPMQGSSLYYDAGVEEVNRIEAALTRVEDAHESLRQAKQALQDAVDEARAAGATWTQVAEPLGVRRQTAWQRFSPVF